MADFPHDCPHCGSKKIGFTVTGDCTAGASFNPQHGRAWFAMCNNKKCAMPVVAIAPSFSDTPDPDTFMAFYPAPPEADIPGYIPENAKRFYEQAENSIP